MLLASADKDNGRKVWGNGNGLREGIIDKRYQGEREIKEGSMVRRKRLETSILWKEACDNLISGMQITPL